MAGSIAGGPVRRARPGTAADADPVRIPLFPLHTVLFPGGILPLHIFEERYRQLVRDGLDFGVVLIAEGREVGGGDTDINSVGTLATLERVAQLPDGGYQVVARGTARFRIDSVDTDSALYAVGEVELLPEPPAAPQVRLLSLLEDYLLELGVTLAGDVRSEDLRPVWLAGAILQAEPAKLQPLLESGDSLLAEGLLSQELSRLRRLGLLAAVPPRPPSKN